MERAFSLGRFACVTPSGAKVGVIPPSSPTGLDFGGPCRPGWTGQAIVIGARSGRAHINSIYRFVKRHPIVSQVNRNHHSDAQLVMDAISDGQGARWLMSAGGCRGGAATGDDADDSSR